MEVNSTISNGSSDVTDRQIPVFQPDLTFLIFQFYIPIIIGITGIVGNGLVCFVFLFKRKVFNSLTNNLILNQSVIDFASSVIFLFQRFAPRPGPSAPPLWQDIVCRIWGSEFILWSFNNTSTGNLILISMERFFAVCYPVTHRNVFTKKRAIYICVIIYILGFLEMWFAPFYSNKYYGCYTVWENWKVQMAIGMYHFFLTYLLPLSSMIYCYANIWRSLKNRDKGREEGGGGAQFGKAKKNVTITLILVAVAFVVCWTPASVSYWLYNLRVPYDITSDMHAVFLTMVLINMCVNPFIYGWKYQPFRREIKHIFCRFNRVGDMTSSQGNSNDTDSTT
ncbi:tachykinin-like peptides receptor 86C [Amphiura filiformis]|uniref:tachykinin-like peptides receptor 86C n=1 Tax=Amphiura filiformis TaxID=82378 RepID=UPI003B226675